MGTSELRNIQPIHHVIFPSGKFEAITKSGTIDQLTDSLPKDVRDALRAYPQYIQTVLSGGQARISKSTGAGDVTLSISKEGVEILDMTRDS